MFGHGHNNLNQHGMSIFPPVLLPHGVFFFLLTVKVSIKHRVDMKTVAEHPSFELSENPAFRSQCISGASMLKLHFRNRGSS